MIIGLNIGYSHVKAVGSTDREVRAVHFPSVVGSPEESHWSPSLGDSTAPATIRLADPERVLIGADAILQSRFVNRREDRTWVLSNEWYLLALAALSQLTRVSGAIRVVTGLPVAFFSDKATVAERLTGTHRVRQEGDKLQNLTIENPIVIPEPYGTLFDQLWDDRGKVVNQDIATGQWGVIDCGGKTTNLLTVNRIREIGRATASISVGVWDAVRGMRSHLEQHCPGLELRDHDVITAIIDRRVRYRGETVRLDQTIDAVLTRLVDQIVSQASQTWSGMANLDGILITGGGALLFGNQLERDLGTITRTRTVSNPIMANARGFWKYGLHLAQ